MPALNVLSDFNIFVLKMDINTVICHIVLLNILLLI